MALIFSVTSGLAALIAANAAAIFFHLFGMGFVSPYRVSKGMLKRVFASVDDIDRGVLGRTVTGVLGRGTICVCTICVCTDCVGVVGRGTICVGAICVCVVVVIARGMIRTVGVITVGVVTVGVITVGP